VPVFAASVTKTFRLLSVLTFGFPKLVCDSNSSLLFLKTGDFLKIKSIETLVLAHTHIHVQVLAHTRIHVQVLAHTHMHVQVLAHTHMHVQVLPVLAPQRRCLVAANTF